MKHVTIKDIARSLCISVSTVSRALTDDKNIRRETREAVLREAERLGYRRNPVAMNLKMGRTNTIGVIVPEMHSERAMSFIVTCFIVGRINTGVMYYNLILFAKIQKYIEYLLTYNMKITVVGLA